MNSKALDEGMIFAVILLFAGSLFTGPISLANREKSLRHLLKRKKNAPAGNMYVANSGNF